MQMRTDRRTRLNDTSELWNRSDDGPRSIALKPVLALLLMLLLVLPLATTTTGKAMMMEERRTAKTVFAAAEIMNRKLMRPASTMTPCSFLHCIILIILILHCHSAARKIENSLSRDDRDRSSRLRPLPTPFLNQRPHQPQPHLALFQPLVYPSYPSSADSLANPPRL